MNRDLMAIVLALSAVDRGFEHWPLRVKPKTLKLVFVASAVSML